MHTQRIFLKGITLLLSLMAAIVCEPCRAQEPVNTPNATEQPQQQPQHQDTPAPEPHPDLKPTVIAIQKLIGESKHTEAIQQADVLLQQATEKGDKIGQAYAHRFRAWALQRLNKLEEALPAWEQAERLWREAGDGALVVEALLGRAFCLWRTNKARAEELVERALQQAKAEVRRPLAAAQALRRMGVEWYHKSVFKVAQRCWEQELAIHERLTPNSLEVATTLHNLGNVALVRGDLDLAQRYYERSLRIRERLAPNSLEVAATLNNLGVVAKNRGDLDLAQRYYEQSLAIKERLAPNSLEVASTLSNLGGVALDRGDLDTAQRYYEQALKIEERLAPNSLEVAQTLGNLGNVALDRGDLDTAQRRHEQALALFKRLAPNSLEVATALNNLGNVARNQGDLDLAQRYYEQSLGIRERLAPNSLEAAATLHNLGNVARERGDLDLAQRYYEQSLGIRERLAPNSLAAASTLNSLGIVARERGDLDTAQRYYEQALAIRERLAPNSLDVAGTLNNLGNVARSRGDLDTAQRYCEQALALFERLAPNSLVVASTLHNLGNVALVRGNLEEAHRYYEQSLAIKERLAPGSLAVASTLNNLAVLRLAQRQPQAALQLLQRAATIVETQRQTIADPETRTLLTEQHFSVYPLLALAHLQLNQPAQAAETLERSRARSLAETLHQRQLALSENLPKPLRQLLQQQQQLNTKRLQTYRQLQQVKSDNKEQIAQLQRLLRDLDQQQRTLDKRIRKEFPDFARQYLPTPLTIQQIQQSLDAGTVLLYHALTKDHLLIVAVSRTQVQGVARKVDSEQLENDIRAFQRLVSRAEDLENLPPGAPLPPRSASDRRELARRGQQLYAQLVAPVQGMLKGAQRVLLCPDGVLSQLPWAALVAQVRNGKPVYWIEQVALHCTPSVGVYRQARRVQPAKRGALIACVSSGVNYPPKPPTPQQTALALPDRETRGVATLLRRAGAGRSLPPLKHALKEAQQLQTTLRPALKNVRMMKEMQATPKQVRQSAQGARIVHLICHGQADHIDPLGSALLLAPVGKDEGLLTAGEVLLNWKLQADLVMLSACETGLGVVRQYEGVYSLGRAFLVAGSRSVGVSLWKVSDASTAALMEAFYKRYARGKPKDAALCEAQRDLRRNSRYDDPYYWAGFVLMGDYR